VVVWSTDPGQHECLARLVARHPGGGIRWTRELSLGLAPLPWRGAIEWQFRIFPSADDGSVEVQLKQVSSSPYNANFVNVARFDASGNGELFRDSANLLVGVARRLSVPNAALTSACTESHLQAPSAAATDVTRIWWFGDGSWKVDDARTSWHCYDRMGDYYAQAIDYNRYGGVVRSWRWEVAVTSTTQLPTPPPPLAVTLSCESADVQYTCDAHPSGGAGNNGFTWRIDGQVKSTHNGQRSITRSCTPDQWYQVRVDVTDQAGTTATATDSVFCSGLPGS
jgi:hypothetical protein